MAQNTMRHRGYTAKITFDEASGRLLGDVIDVATPIRFEGDSVEGLRAAFARAVDDHVADCARRNVAPQKPFSGKLLLRLPPDLHRRATIAAATLEVSLNDFLVGAIEVGVTRLGITVDRTAPPEAASPPTGPRAAA
jgi:predicted HicB family RNase H-like nuclease